MSYHSISEIIVEYPTCGSEKKLTREAKQHTVKLLRSAKMMILVGYPARKVLSYTSHGSSRPYQHRAVTN